MLSIISLHCSHRGNVVLHVPMQINAIHVTHRRTCDLMGNMDRVWANGTALFNPETKYGVLCLHLAQHLFCALLFYTYLYLSLSSHLLYMCLLYSCCEFALFLLVSVYLDILQLSWHTEICNVSTVTDYWCKCMRHIETCAFLSMDICIGLHLGLFPNAGGNENVHDFTSDMIRQQIIICSAAPSKHSLRHILIGSTES